MTLELPSTSTISRSELWALLLALYDRLALGGVTDLGPYTRRLHWPRLDAPYGSTLATATVATLTDTGAARSAVAFYDGTTLRSFSTYTTVESLVTAINAACTHVSAEAIGTKGLTLTCDTWFQITQCGPFIAEFAHGIIPLKGFAEERPLSVEDDDAYALGVVWAAIVLAGYAEALPESPTADVPYASKDASTGKWRLSFWTGTAWTHQVPSCRRDFKKPNGDYVIYNGAIFVDGANQVFDGHSNCIARRASGIWQFLTPPIGYTFAHRIGDKDLLVTYTSSGWKYWRFHAGGAGSPIGECQICVATLQDTLASIAPTFLQDRGYDGNDPLDDLAETQVTWTPSTVPGKYWVVDEDFFDSVGLQPAGWNRSYPLELANSNWIGQPFYLAPPGLPVWVAWVSETPLGETAEGYSITFTRNGDPYEFPYGGQTGFDALVPLLEADGFLVRITAVGSEYQSLYVYPTDPSQTLTVSETNPDDEIVYISRAAYTPLTPITPQRARYVGDPYEQYAVNCYYEWSVAQKAWVISHDQRTPPTTITVQGRACQGDYWFHWPADDWIRVCRALCFRLIGHGYHYATSYVWHYACALDYKQFGAHYDGEGNWIPEWENSTWLTHSLTEQWSGYVFNDLFTIMPPPPHGYPTPIGGYCDYAHSGWQYGVNELWWPYLLTVKPLGAVNLTGIITTPAGGGYAGLARNVDNVGAFSAACDGLVSTSMPFVPDTYTCSVQAYRINTTQIGFDAYLPVIDTFDAQGDDLGGDDEDMPYLIDEPYESQGALISDSHTFTVALGHTSNALPANGPDAGYYTTLAAVLFIERP